MAILEYNLRAVGEADIARSLAVVERRFVSHAARINRTLAVGGGAIRARASASPDQLARAAARVRRSVMTDEQHAQRVVAASQQRYDLASHRQKLRNIEREKREEIAKIRATNRAAEREQDLAKRTFLRATGGGARNAARTLGAVGMAGVGMLGVGGSVLAGAAVTEQLRLDEQIRRFSVAGRGKGEAGLDPEMVRRQVNAISLETGIAPENVMRGISKFQADTGDTGKALAYGRSVATFSQATGADPEEVAAAAASLFSNFKIQDLHALNAALATLTAQGKKGSFEFRGMAGQLSRITASFTGRGVGAEALTDVGAIAQVVKKGTGSDDVTTTAIDAMFRQLISKSTELQSGAAFSGRKVEVFKGGKATSGMRSDLANLIADTLTASRGNVAQLQKIFGDEGMKGVGLFAAEYQRASTAAGGGEKGSKAGRAAVLGMIDEFNVKGHMGEVQRDAADVMKSASIQFEMATQELKQAVSAELLPVVRDLVPHVRELGPPLRDVTKGLVALGSAAAEHPFLGLGALLAGSIAVEVGKAQLGLVIQQSLTPAMMAATMSTLKFAGAAGAAAVAVYAAYDQNESLKTETGGKGILDVGWEWATTDKSLKEIADENLDRQAKEEAAKRTGLSAGEIFSAGMAPTPTAPVGPTSAVTPTVTPSGSTAPPVRTLALDAAAASAKSVAAELDALRASVQAANAELAKVRGTPVNRGNSPSPVKG